MASNNWRNSLRPASWRGVAFQVAGDDAEFGRHAAVHEFVQRDRPYVEDLGRKTRKFKLEAWVCASIDNDFNPWPQRDALIAAVEQGGVGTLVHPYYGSLRGHVLGITVKQTSSTGGGMVGMSLDFTEAGELDFKSTTAVDTRGRVSDSATAVYTSARDEFAASFNTSGVPGFVADDARAMVQQLNAVLKSQPGPSGLPAQVSLNNLVNARV